MLSWTVGHPSKEAKTILLAWVSIEEKLLAIIVKSVILNVKV